MKLQVFDQIDPVQIISFHSAIKLALDTNRVDERAAFWMLHFLEAPSCPLRTGVLASRAKS